MAFKHYYWRFGNIEDAWEIFSATDDERIQWKKTFEEECRCNILKITEKIQILSYSNQHLCINCVMQFEKMPVIIMHNLKRNWLILVLKMLSQWIAQVKLTSLGQLDLTNNQLHSSSSTALKVPHHEDFTSTKRLRGFSRILSCYHFYIKIEVSGLTF